MKIPVFYFSGTGNTEYLARQTGEAFYRMGFECSLLDLAEREPFPEELPDLFGICSCVHAWRVPRLVLKQLRRIPSGSGQRVLIFLTSGGGESPVNDNASRALCRILHHKGYKVVYVRNFLMSSNWMERRTTAEVKVLSRQLDKEVRHSVKEILQGIERPAPLFRPGMLLFAFAGVMEAHGGARLFGKRIEADDRCTRCGLCARSCPSSNIFIDDTGVRFGFNCLWCMRCLNICPENALFPRFVSACKTDPPYYLANELKKETSAEEIEAASLSLANQFPDYFKDKE